MHVLPIYEDAVKDTQKLKPNATTDGNPGGEPPDIIGKMLTPELSIVKKIGTGTYGIIYLVEDIKSGQKYAAKIVIESPPVRHNCCKSTSENKKTMQRSIQEYFMAHSCFDTAELNLDWIRDNGAQHARFKEIAFNLRVQDSVNIVTIHKVYELGNFATVIVMDYFEQGDLFNHIIKRQIFLTAPLDVDRLLLMKNCILQILGAIQHCAEKGVYHCDLKPENIMVEFNANYRRTDRTRILDYDEIRVVLIDFGLAIDSPTIPSNVCRGSSFYMAPERVMNYNASPLLRSLVDMNRFESIHDSKTDSESSPKLLPTLAGDVWSLGVLLINITCARNPWPVASLLQDENQVFRTYIMSDQSLLRTIIPISRSFNRLLNRIFTLDPHERITLDQLEPAITVCDFFHDREERQLRLVKSHEPPTDAANTQLHTPPDTCSHNDSLFGSVCSSTLSAISLHSHLSRPSPAPLFAK